MRFYMRTITLLILIATLFGQDYGRMQAPGTESGSSEVQAAIALKEEAFALERIIDPDQYILGPGDKIGLNIQASINHTLPLTITPTGDLFIPSVGVCHVSGYTLTAGTEVVRKYVLDQAYPTAQINMALVSPRHFLLQVSGAVRKPGFVIVTPLSRLDEVIEKAGKFHQLAKEFEILVTRSDEKQELVNFHKYVLGGNLNSNPTFLEGDRVSIPFGDLEKSGIVVRGSVGGGGYDIISESETLGNYIKRKVRFGKNADLRNVTLTRTIDNAIVHLVIAPNNFDKTVLKAQDEINFLWERGVMVNGFVQTPGGFSFYPGYSVADYISLAGGNSINGDPRRVKVIHQDGVNEYGDEVIVMRGDVIYVPRTRKDIFIGNSSILGVLTALATVYLTFLAVK
ncbi:MAG: SLBB domain-containing protein [Candidatus Marinimicrobia bacterium]|nr:SLBB domain-containing protein [Candidatus Neomarinimicrobiota bacterium]